MRCAWVRRCVALSRVSRVSSRSTAWGSAAGLSSVCATVVQAVLTQSWISLNAAVLCVLVSVLSCALVMSREIANAGKCQPGSRGFHGVGAAVRHAHKPVELVAGVLQEIKGLLELLVVVDVSAFARAPADVRARTVQGVPVQVGYRLRRSGAGSKGSELLKTAREIERVVETLGQLFVGSGKKQIQPRIGSRGAAISRDGVSLGNRCLPGHGVFTHRGPLSPQRASAAVEAGRDFGFPDGGFPHIKRLGDLPVGEAVLGPRHDVPLQRRQLDQCVQDPLISLFEGHMGDGTRTAWAIGQRVVRSVSLPCLT